MRIVTIVVLLIAWLFSNPCSAQVVAQPTKAANTFHAKTEYGDLYVQVESPVVYVPKEGETEISGFVSSRLEKDGVGIKDVGGFFDVKPKPVKVRLGKSPDYDKTESPSRSTYLVFRNAGDINVVVELGDQLIYVPIKVVQLPYNKGSDSDLLISDLGIPVTNKTHYIEWPTNRFIEGAFYSVSAQESIYSVEHWRFNQFPHCIFSIRDHKLFKIQSNYTPEPELPQEVRDPVDRPKRTPPVLDRFTMADGKTVLMARFVDFRRAQVYLENADGKTLQFKLSEFDSASSAKIRNAFKQMGKAEITPKKSAK